MKLYDELKSSLHYDRESGIFSWLSSTNRRIKIGAKAGCVGRMASGKSYIIIGYQGKNYYAHRIAFLLETGEMPREEVDHINGDGTDNRFCNLRMVSRSENAKNLRGRTGLESGVCGVYKCSRTTAWVPAISDKGMVIKLGRTRDLFSAICLRKSAEITYGYHKNHGRYRPL